MSKISKEIIFLLAFLLTANGFLYSPFADQDENRDKGRHQKKERKHSECNGKGNLTVVNNQTYTENCGACHFAYQPGLLPSGSWDKILNSLTEHFGEDINLDPESKKIIAKYLKANSADHSSAALSAKIMKCIGNQIPQRITEIPYIQKRHEEISSNVLKRESIGSLSNCSACHQTAAKGSYNEDSVKVPK